MPMSTGLENHDPEDVSRVALKVFFEIVDRWSLNSQEAKNLLGRPSDRRFDEWQQNQKVQEAIPKETLERISYVMGIHKALRTIFEDKQRADAWIKKPNKYFGGDSALDVMLAGRLKDVRKYLDDQIQI